ncbi:hypothetical protein B4U80_14775, partial [Leptotrombidium deliense]
MDNDGGNNRDTKRGGAEFWKSCYSRKCTGWQLNTVHSLLVKYIHLLEPQKPSTIFVPLYGKSLDIQ